MKHMSGIDGSQRAALPAVRAEAAGHRATRPRPGPVADLRTAPEPGPGPVLERPAFENLRTDEQYATAVAELQKALDEVDGPARDVDLRFDDEGDYVVEIRRRDDGVVIQQFPPENLLNPGPSPADLLGTVVDRRS